MSATTPENKVKKAIDKILKPYRLSGQLWYNKTAGSMFGVNGVPDYLCCLVGRFFSIEAKAGKGKPSELQLMQMTGITKAGGTCLVINENNLQELEDFLSANS